MADYSLAEQKVLKELGVPDFKHITKDNIVMLRTALDKCDPEVAKTIIAQIPETLKFSSEYVSTVGYYTSKTLENDKLSSEVINEQNLKIIDSFTSKLNDPNSSEEIQSKTIDALVHINDNNTSIEHAKIESRKEAFCFLKNLGKIVLAVSCIIGGGYIVTKASNQDELNQSNNEID